MYHILWVQVFRDHTISGRGFNLFKPLRRHFRAIPFCRQVLSRRDPDDRNASVQEIDDRLGGLLRDGGAGTNIEQPRNFGKKFVERLGAFEEVCGIPIGYMRLQAHFLRKEDRLCPWQASDGAPPRVASRLSRSGMDGDGQK